MIKMQSGRCVLRATNNARACLLSGKGENHRASMSSSREKSRPGDGEI